MLVLSKTFYTDLWNYLQDLEDEVLSELENEAALVEDADDTVEELKF